MSDETDTGAQVTRSQTAVATNPGSGQQGGGNSVNVGAQAEMAAIVTNPVHSQSDMCASQRRYCWRFICKHPTRGVS